MNALKQSSRANVKLCPITTESRGKVEAIANSISKINTQVYPSSSAGYEFDK
jgi:hypothetical protein